MKKKNKKQKSSTQKSNPKGKIQPLGDRVLVKPLSGEEAGKTLSSGIIIPETVDKEKPERGKVIAVGDGKFENGKLVPVRVRVGDMVVFSKYGYDEIKVEGEEYFILREESILAVIN